MALVICNECDGKISEKAYTCVHCGSPLLKDAPGVVGVVLRGLYILFCAVLVLICIVAFADRTLDLQAKILVPVIEFGIWFLVSLSIAVLLYVTRLGNTHRVEGAVRSD